MRRRTALFAVFASAAALVVAAPSAQQRETREQHVYVGVTSGSSQTPVEGLTPADFVVREDGVAREVLRVTPAPPPTHVALVVDDSAVVQAVVTDLRGGLTQFLTAMAGLSPQPLVSLTTFGERPTQVVPYAADPALVLKGIDRIFGRPGSGAYFIDAVLEESATLAKTKAERPVIVAFVVEDGPEYSTPTSSRVADSLKASGAQLWTIALQARSADLSSTEARERASVLTDVARRSGGDSRSVLTRQAIPQAFSRLAAQLQARYDVVYARPDALVPPEKLQVEVRRGGTRVTAPGWTTRR